MYEWSLEDKSPCISLLSNGLLERKVNKSIRRKSIFSKRSSIESDVSGFISSKNPIPKDDKKLYFEVTIEDEGEGFNVIAVGLSTKALFKYSELLDLSGFSTLAYVYRSDGNIFCDAIKIYEGSEYGQGDVIGCYADYINGIYCFTKNGIVVSETIVSRSSECMPFQKDLYPTIGLNSDGTIVRTNFGENIFTFNLQGMSRS